MKLAEYAKGLRVKSKGSGAMYADEIGALHDDLLRPFHIMSDQENELMEAKKAATYDENAKLRIQPLKAKIATNQKVLDRLEVAVAELKLEPMSLGRLRQRQQDLTWAIRSEESALADNISPYFLDALKTLGEPGLKAAEKHPKVLDARSTSEAKIRGIQEEYASIGEKIRILENILKDFEVV